MKLVIIAAIGKNRELGIDNHLIWHLPNDLKFFKEKTTGKTIVMGRHTFESLGRLLPNRTHIVLSKSTNSFPKEVIIFKSVEEFLKNYKNDEEVFIIGGASIYNEFINYADKMFLTEVEEVSPEADVFFPKFNKEEWNKEVISENQDNGICYKHIKYERK